MINVGKKIYDIDFSDKNIAIIGKPTSGKSYLAEKLHEKYPNHVLISTDEYLVHEKDDLIRYYIMRDVRVAEMQAHYIIEGMLVYYLLNEPFFKPDALINVNITERKMKENYVFDRNFITNRNIVGFTRKHDALFKDFLIADNEKTPIYKINNKNRIL